MSGRADLRVGVADLLPIVDARLYLGLFEERFGIPAATFAEYSFFKANAQAIWIVRRDLRLPARPVPYAVGMPFYYYRMIHPRPTTPDGAALGTPRHPPRHRARRRADRPLRRLPGSAAAGGPGSGLQPRLLADALPRPAPGVGLATTDDADRPIFRAMTPKFWRLRLDQLIGGPDDTAEMEE